MSKGFGGLNRAKAKAIIQSLKQSSVFKNEDVAYERRIWDDDYSFRTCDPIGEDELFQPSTYLYRNAEIAALLALVVKHKCTSFAYMKIEFPANAL